MSGADAAMVQSPHRLVRASAGSGKTFALTNAYLGLLCQDENPSDLLATTFTRAAAGEILHRALERLSDAVVDDKALKELQTHVDAELTHQRCAQTLERVVDNMHRLSVMTIDSFFARLATSFSLELGLAPGWRMLDEEEDDAIRAAAVVRILRDATDEEMLGILRDLQGEKVRAHAHREIMEVVERGYGAYLATLGNTAPWSAIQPVGKAMDEASLESARQALAQADIPMTKAGGPDKRWRKALDSTVQSVGEEEWEAFVDAGLGKAVVQARATDEIALYYGKEMPAAIAGILEPIVEHARWRLTTEHVMRTTAGLELLARFDDVYSNMKRSLGGVTFDDPPRFLLRAKTTGDLEHLYFRLDARIRHVLLDEFQDTSMAQFWLLEPILDELLSQASDGRSVFCVGDVKQSLYAWREAEPTLLPALAGRWPTLQEETLSKSWRSSPAVLAAVNEIFTNATSNEAMQSSDAGQRAAQEWDAGFDAHVAAHKNLPGEARLSVAEETELSDKDESRAALETAAQRVAEARERAPGASVAVLVRYSKDLYTILGMLKHRGIDASERRGNPLADAPPVAAAVSMLSLIEHPGHSAALFHVAHSPLGKAVGLTDTRDDTTTRRVTAELRQRIATSGCADVLSEWLGACAGAMDSRGVARFEQLIDLAESFDATQAGGPAQLAALAQTRRIDEPGRAPVRVMTIHGSKGLEFDVVVVPLVSAKAWQVRSGTVIMGRDEPLGPVTRVSRYPSKMMRLLHPELESLHAQALQRQITEEMCCLYVATTRARHCLELVVPADKKGRQGETLASDQWRLHPAHVVRAALAPQRAAEPGATLWSSSTDARWSDMDRLQLAATPEAKPEIVALKTRAPKRRSAARLASVSPSQMGGGKTIDAESLLVPGSRVARILGELVHMWFEQIEWLDAGAPDDAGLLALATDKGFDEDVAREALRGFGQAIQSEPIRSALSESAWRSRMPGAREVRVFRERPFAVRDADAHGDRLLQGRFDRLVVGYADGQAVCAEVFDFKTDRAAEGCEGEELAAIAEHHRLQMEAYRRAAAGLLRLPESSIATTLVFTAAGQTVTLKPESKRASESG